MVGMTQDPLAQNRAYGTSEERMVLALELIADQLRSLVALVTPEAVSDISHDAAVARQRDATGEGAWENEGGSLDKGSTTPLGIKHSVKDHFETGGYHYTKLADAVAEANRSSPRQSA